MQTFDGFLKRLTAKLKDDSGAAALVIAAVIAIVAFTALTVFLRAYTGGRELERAQLSNRSQGQIAPALFAYLIQQTPTHTLPCPDTKATPDGTASACNGAGTTSGVFPWKDIGISQDAVVDPYGNYLTYVVSATAKNMCTSVANDYSAAAGSEITGSLISAGDLTLTAPTGARNVPFAIIGHGKNGYGAKSRSGGTTSAPTNVHELANQNGGTPATIYADTYSPTFDDQVYAPPNYDMEKVCKSLTPGSALNATIAENFESAGAALPTSFTAGGGTPPMKARTSDNNGVASFGATSAYMATSASYYLTPVVRPLYVSAKWTADADSASASAGMSIAVRATAADITAGTDTFVTHGLTFRFYESSATNVGTPNHISIRDAGAAVATSAGTYSLIAGKVYIIESFDDGTNLWMRITQNDNAANTVTVRATTTPTTDSGGSQSVIFINDIAAASLSYLDEISIGLPMLTLETDGTGDIVFSPDGTNGFAGSAPHSLTIEAWVKPTAYPPGDGVVVSKWDADGTTPAASQGYRLSLDSTGTANLSLSGSVGGTISKRSYGLRFQPELNKWTHIAVVYDAAAATVTAYKNGVIASVTSSDIDGGVNSEVARRFSAGGEYTGGGFATVADVFIGDISDVRVWEAARSGMNILTCYQTRLPSTTCPATNLLINWKLDPGVNGLTSTVAAATTGTNGALLNATYVPALSIFFRPTSADFCPSGTRVGAYECDFRGATAPVISVPSNLSSVYAKVWGAGGGTSLITFNGGGGAFSGGIIPTVAGSLDITIGTGGASGAVVGLAGTASTILRGATTLLQSNPGTGATLVLDGVGGSVTAPDASIVYPVTAPGTVAPVPGCSPAGDPCTDTYYSPTYLSALPALQNPGRGGTSGDDTGHDGAAVIIW